MKRNLVLTTLLVMCLSIAGHALAGGPKGSQRRGAEGSLNGTVRARTIQRSLTPAVPAAPHYPLRYYPWHYYHYGHNPRSIIIITPSSHDPYSLPAAIVTSEPYYCHMHHVGFVSRVGFLDHISGTHKIPLETANSICSDANESCVIEGY